MKNMKRECALWILALAVTVGLIGLVSCKGKSAQDKMAEKVSEKILESASGGKTDVDIKEGKVKIKTEEGESEIAADEKEWPKDLPEGVPQFTMGKVKGVTKSNVQGKKSWNVFLEDVEEGAAEKYTEVLKSHQWNIMQTMTMGEGGMTQAMKNDVMIMAIYNRKDKAASISVSTQMEE